MKIVVDDKIPFIQEPLRKICNEVNALPGNRICAADVRDADILIVRTRTRCDASLLEGSRVKLLLTATIGYDHLDTAWLETTDIRWYNCPGCNATSVAQYIECSLLLLQQEHDLPLKDATLGIVGVGHVGTAVMQRLQHQVKSILLNDILPERCPTRGNLRAATLKEIATEADIITFHTPLTCDGDAPTFHLANRHFFHHLGRRPVIINAARGGVVDEKALIEAYHQGHVRDMVIDTWETEPTPNPELLQEAYLATPHIAGYSADGKLNATCMCLKHVVAYLNSISEPVEESSLYPSLHPVEIPDDVMREKSPSAIPLYFFNPKYISEALKATPKHFEQLRNAEPNRREPH